MSLRLSISIKIVRVVLGAWGVLIGAVLARADQTDERLELRLWTIPETGAANPRDAANAKVIELFRERHPNVELRKSSGIQIPQIGSSAALLMAIAGGVAPDVLESSHENLYGFVQQGFLVPLDEYIEGIPEHELYERAPKQVWDAARLRGPDGEVHLYAMPYTYAVSAFRIRHDVMAQMGIAPSRWPRTWEEVYTLGQEICATSDSRGFGLPKGEGLSDTFQTMLIARGGEPWRIDESGKLWASFDDERAIDTMDYLWRLAVGPWERDGRQFSGICYSDIDMWYAVKRQRYLMGIMSFRPEVAGILAGEYTQRFRLLPMPAAPDGTSRPRLTAQYAGIFAGQSDPRVRQAAFDFVLMQGTTEARRIKTQILVEADEALGANPLDLERFGYTRELAMLPEGYLEFFKRSLRDGYLPPVGPGADELRRAIAKPVQLILVDRTMVELSPEQRRERIGQVLRQATADANQRLHQTIDADQARWRQHIAMALAVLIFAAFAFQLWLAQRTYAAKLGTGTSGQAARGTLQDRGLWRGWSRGTKVTCTLAPALGLIALWEYYPLLRGTAIAFQDYRFLEGTRYVGLENFSNVLFSEHFWMAMLRSGQYTVLSLALGFLAPVFLAILLHELPRGTLLFRILYYLPSLTTGIVVIFLWKSFYDPGPNGLINYLLSFARIAPQAWLDDPNLAMLCCVLPTVWILPSFSR